MDRDSTDLIPRKRLLIFPEVSRPVFIPAALAILAFIIFGAAFTRNGERSLRRD